MNRSVLKGNWRSLLRLFVVIASFLCCTGYNDHHGDTSNHVKRSKDRSLPFETRPVTHAHSNTDVTRRTVRHDATDRRVHRHASAAAESDSSVTTTVWRNGAQSSTIGAARRVVSVFFAACNALMLSRPCWIGGAFSLFWYRCLRDLFFPIQIETWLAGVVCYLKKKISIADQLGLC